MTATDAVNQSLSENFKEFFLKHTPIKRMGTPENIANTVLYFASDDSSYTTGQIVDVSGGFGLATPIYGDMIMMKDRR
jgi:NAD(P)-dependent dehydrogenase (short-subunit alcohol dehydrogenase family)